MAYGTHGARQRARGCAASRSSQRHQMSCAPSCTDLYRLKTLLAPYPSEEMTCWPVSTRVGNMKNSDPSLIEPLAVTDKRTSPRRLRGTIVA